MRACGAVRAEEWQTMQTAQATQSGQESAGGDNVAQSTQDAVCVALQQVWPLSLRHCLSELRDVRCPVGCPVGCVFGCSTTCAADAHVEDAICDGTSTHAI